MGRYLGLDSSTQSLSALIIDTGSGRVVVDESLRFGESLPHYGSPTGFLPNADVRIRHADPLMWVEALDLLFTKLAASGVDLGQIDGICGAAQQHGSVYLQRPLREVSAWDPSRDLVSQVRPLLARSTAPLWLDSSTASDCEAITHALGGHARVSRLSGSRAIERFTGPQVRAFWRRDPEAYARTREIHLVSSFLASLLSGTSAPIDHGDGAGMNLLDLETGSWSDELMAATAPGLAAKLPSVVPCRTVIGEIGAYFVERFGFSSGTPLVAFTGDNPSSLVGMGGTEPGTVVVSMGTSDTVFAATRAPRPDPNGFGHVFGNPAGGFMCLICFANGSLAREEVARRAGLSWSAFEHAIIHESEPGNQGNLLLPFFVPEMTPRIPTPQVELIGSEEFVAWREPARLARAVVEAQALSMRRYSDYIGERPKLVRVTGGAAKNRGIRQVLADVFEAEVRALQVNNSAVLGSALRAAEALGPHSFAELYDRFSVSDPTRSASPSLGVSDRYHELSRQLAGRLELMGV